MVLSFIGIFLFPSIGFVYCTLREKKTANLKWFDYIFLGLIAILTITCAIIFDKGRIMF